MVNKLIQVINTLNERLGQFVAWLTTALVLLVCFNVLYRYALNENIKWLKELEWHLFALIFLWGAAYTLKHDAHVRVDLFYDRMHRRDRALVNFIGSLVFLIPWTLLLIYTSWSYALEAWRIGEGSPESGGLPAWYPIKFAIPIGMSLLFLQACSLLLRSWQRLRQPLDQPPKIHEP